MVGWGSGICPDVNEGGVPLPRSFYAQFFDDYTDVIFPKFLDHNMKFTFVDHNLPTVDHNLPTVDHILPCLQFFSKNVLCAFRYGP